jgi:hypothetical protein
VFPSKDDMSFLGEPSLVGYTPYLVSSLRGLEGPASEVFGRDRNNFSFSSMTKKNTFSTGKLILDLKSFAFCPRLYRFLRERAAKFFLSSTKLPLVGG